MSFPPQDKHRVQSLDVAVYGPIKSYFKQEITFHKQHPGRIATPRIGGFFSSEIWPFNSRIFDDFAPSNVPDDRRSETAPLSPERRPQVHSSE